MKRIRQIVKKRSGSFQYMLYSFRAQMVYVISISVMQVSGPDVLCHFSICHTGFKTI